MKTPVHNTLKKFMWLVGIFLLTHVLHAQIPNWNFESWNTYTNDVPAPWITFGTTSKVSPGANGQFAVKLQASIETGPGAVLHGLPSGNDNFFGGTPFTDRPDSMVAHFKYDIAIGDSAWVLVIFKKNGQNISDDLYLLYGNHTSDFTRKAFKIHYTSGVTPDTVVVGFTSTIPNGGGLLNLDSYVILDNISFTGTAQNVPNADFETWTTQVTHTPVGWQSDFRPLGSSVEQSSDAYSENYALKVQTIFGNQGDTIGGYTETVSPDGSGFWGPDFAVNSRPTSLKGFFKFTPENGDTFRIMVNLFKDGQQVGQGQFMSDDMVSTYTPFSAPIDYFALPSGNPDSASISIATYVWDNYPMPRGESVALIDNLSFDDFIYAGTDELLTSGNMVSLYPNPAEKNVYVRLDALKESPLSVSIINMLGKEVAVFPLPATRLGNDELQLDVSSLPAGTYMIRLQNEHSVAYTRLIIER
jgi:hypothetical protein